MGAFGGQSGLHLLQPKQRQTRACRGTPRQFDGLLAGYMASASMSSVTS